MTAPDQPPPSRGANDARALGGGEFQRCEGCAAVHETRVFETTYEVCPACGHHHRLSPERYRRLLLDDATFAAWDTHLESADPIEFTADVPYPERIAAAQRETGARDAIETGRARLGGHDIAYGCFRFAFLGGSMGSVVGEKVARLFERAASARIPAVLLQTSGGARMQEGIVSLMQMAKTVGARERLRAACVPFVSVMLGPTTGGVAASTAFLGDVNVAEPGALIGFAGPRVIEATVGGRLPEGFQRSEFLLDHGMVDLVVPRAELRAALVRLLGHLRPPPAA